MEGRGTGEGSGLYLAYASSPLCSRCSHPVERILHCLRDCPHSKEVWGRLGALAWRHFDAQGVYEWVPAQIRGGHSILFLAALWELW